MGKKNQYPVQKFYGFPVTTSPSGEYVLKKDHDGKAKVHTWRTGKHTRGKYQGVGQLLLTENNLTVVIVKAEPMAFKDRHSETPLQRFLDAWVSPTVLKEATARFAEEDQ